MELPKRPKGERYERPGRYRELEHRLRQSGLGDANPALMIYAFDHRTRLGPYLFVDKWLIPGAPRSIASALHAAGFEQTRAALQQWSPNLRPSEARFDGRPPALLLVSSMQIHSEAAYRLIEDAHRLGDDRPLIIAGGPKAIYEPWDFFGLGPDGRLEADVVVTGEELVLLELLERVNEFKGARDSLRAAFERARAAGALASIPGLVYRKDGLPGGAELEDTGIQKLVEDLDELPLPFDALGLFEPPHRGRTLSERPVPADQLGTYAKLLAIITTHGCKFHCPYCPIPAFNQDTFRYRSPERLVEELAGFKEISGIHNFFGTDDNFFNNRESAREILQAMSRGTAGGKPFRDAIWFGTEATEFDVDKNSDLLPLARDAGLQAIWFGIEDMTAELVKKGQSPEKTERVFHKLVDHGIAPMPMLMHHDGQPLRSRDGLYGLLNQVEFLRKAGAVSVQVTFLTPMVGTKGFEQPYKEGMVMGKVAGQPVDDYRYDGNHCIATHHPRPWRLQLNISLAYLSFYNPWNLVKSYLKRDKLREFRVVYQSFGFLGAVWTLWNAAPWIARLMTGRIEKLADVPKPALRMTPAPGLAEDLAHHERDACVPAGAGTETEVAWVETPTIQPPSTSGSTSAVS